jgi:hypothetical protein
LYTNILKNKLVRLTKGYLQDEQCDFRKGRSCIDAKFRVQQIIEKTNFSLPTFPLFLDYEKACDKLNRDVLRKILQEGNMPAQWTEVLKSLYEDTELCIRFTDGQLSEPTPINRVVRQGCGLSPTAFKIFI